MRKSVMVVWKTMPNLSTEASLKLFSCHFYRPLNGPGKAILVGSGMCVRVSVYLCVGQ